MRRQPTFFREAVETCRNESSFLTSSKSVSEVNYEGFTGAKGLNNRDEVENLPLKPIQSYSLI